MFLLGGVAVETYMYYRRFKTIGSTSTHAYVPPLSVHNYSQNSINPEHRWTPHDRVLPRRSLPLSCILSSSTSHHGFHSAGPTSRTPAAIRPSSTSAANLGEPSLIRRHYINLKPRVAQRVCRAGAAVVQNTSRHRNRHRLHDRSSTRVWRVTQAQNIADA